MGLLEVLTLILVILTVGGLGFAGYQIWLIRKQIRGEVYKIAKIKDLCFFLPDKRAYVVKGFENSQKDRDEVDFGKEIKVPLDSNRELFVKFVLDAPQRLRIVTLGFAQRKDDGTDYEGHPVVSTLRTTFKAKETSHFEREVYMDWHQHWHMEFPFPRFLAKGDCFVLCFEIASKDVGRYPLDFEVITEEAKSQYTQRLWVKVTN